MTERHPKALATPLLFRYLNLDINAPNSSRLRGFARHARLRSTEGDAICSRLRSLRCLVPTTLAAEDLSNMAYILLNAKNLGYLRIGGRGVLSSMLFMSIHSASSTLHSLDVFVKNEMLLDAQHIGQLKRLKSLEVFSMADWSTAYVFWDMPSLIRLKWEGCIEHSTLPPCSGDLKFLTQCRFAALQDFSLLVTRSDEPASLDLEELMRLVKGPYTSVGILLQPAQARALLPHTHTSILNLHRSPIIADMAECLHARTECLVVNIIEANLNGWWQFLTAMCTQARTGNSSLRAIKVFSSLAYLPRFTWGYDDGNLENVPREAAEFQGRLLGFAIRLKARGIHIVDTLTARFDGLVFA
jgi:hypothetical protein